MDVLTIAILVLQGIISVSLAIVLAGFKLNSAVGAVKGRYAAEKRKQYEKTWSSMEKKRAYDEIDEWLTSHGVKYRKGSIFSPFDYMCIRFLWAIILGLFMMIIEPFLLPIGLLAGYWAVPWIYNSNDREDNAKMEKDISIMYGIVSLQLKNNVFLSEVIYECSLSVDYPRLKTALLELSDEIGKFSSIKEAAIRFRKKFNNQHIDSFAKTIEQLETTGEASELFEKLESQIEGINEALALRTEKKIDNVSGVFQTLIFICSILFIGYQLVSMLVGTDFF